MMFVKVLSISKCHSGLRWAECVEINMRHSGIHPGKNEVARNIQHYFVIVLIARRKKGRQRLS